jgi:glyoxylase-like metal-dependent hydrolase (beta-lactamase superfamily II)
MPPSPDLNLIHPYLAPPGPGRVVEAAPGVLWARLPLPFRLNHVNIYLIEDEGGWAVVDTGIDDRPSRSAWTQLLDGPLAGRQLTRLIVTHCHPDHVGLANWLAERSGLTLEMTETEYLTALVLHLDPEALDADPYRQFYVDHGLDEETTAAVMTRGHDYLRMLSGLPATFRRVIAGERLRIGGREFEVLTGGGHAPEQIMLHASPTGSSCQPIRCSPASRRMSACSRATRKGTRSASSCARSGRLKRRVPEDVLVLPATTCPSSASTGGSTR